MATFPREWESILRREEDVRKGSREFMTCTRSWSDKIFISFVIKKNAFPLCFIAPMVGPIGVGVWEEAGRFVQQKHLGRSPPVVAVVVEAYAHSRRAVYSVSKLTVYIDIDVKTFFTYTMKSHINVYKTIYNLFVNFSICELILFFLGTPSKPFWLHR